MKTHKQKEINLNRERRLIRVNRLLKHPEYIRCLGEIKKSEENRSFCCHDLNHFLDVARIAMILNLTEEVGVEEEQIYAAALLHDIGRHLQYQKGIPHEEASACLASDMLEHSGFSQEEMESILTAILGHRREKSAQEKNLTGLLYRADKASRSCFSCPVESDCNWSQDDKNLEIIR